MTNRTAYTLYMKTEAGEQIVARGVSPIDAMRYVVEREPERRFLVTSEAYEGFRRFDWSLSIDQLSYARPTLHATVPLTEDYDADEASALELIAVQFLRVAHQFWDGWVDTDADFEERLQDEVRHAAEREEAERIEREIAAKFVEALTRDGYEMVTDTFGNEFALTNPSDRDDLTKTFFDNYGMTKYTIVKRGEQEHFGIGYGQAPVDFVQSRGEAIYELIERIIAPYRRDPQRAAEAGTITGRLPEGTLESDADVHEMDSVESTHRTSVV